MRSWEYSKSIIAFFQSYPQVSELPLSFYSTVISNNISTYQKYHSSFDNPETKEDPYEIIEEVIALLKELAGEKISIDLVSNLDYVTSERHHQIFQTYVLPLLQSLTSQIAITEYREMTLDLFSLQGLYDEAHRRMIPEVVNTVIYV